MVDLTDTWWGVLMIWAGWVVILYFIAPIVLAAIGMMLLGWG